MKKNNLPDNTLLPDPEQAYYDARQFLLLAKDSAFIDSAYDCILKRPPDQDGRDSYGAGLAKGSLRQQMLADLRLSSEGEKHAVEVTHLDSFLTWVKLKHRSPFAARLLAPGFWLLAKGLNRIQQIQARRLRAWFAWSQEIRRSIERNNDETKALSRRVDAVEDQSALIRSRLQLLTDRYANPSPRKEAEQTAPEGAPFWQDPQQKQWQEDFSSFYLDFEIAFRGSREAIHERLSHYLQFLPSPGAATPPVVVDLGCGRGEWLALLEQSGYTARGLDSSPVMQQICREQGLNVSGDPMHQWLQHQADASIAAITAFHLAEHLPFEYLLALVKEAKRLLQPGGVLILETQNPESLRVSAYAFYHDPTHRNPLTPELLEFMARYAGFDPVQLEKLSEVPKDLHIRETTQTAVQFNQLLNAPQDLALIAFQPIDAAEQGITAPS